jgi:hypothetical protein
MKRQLISIIFLLPLFVLFFSSEIHAQPADGALPGTKSTTTGAPGAKETKSGSSGPTMLAFGAERKGKLDPRTSKSDSGTFFEDIHFRGESDDSLSFRLMSADPSLGLQLFGRNNTEIAVRKDPSGDFRIATPTGGLPADGEYRVRVTGALSGKSAVPFTIKLDRLGLTAVAYVERFNRIYASYNDKDPASVDETVVKLEKLAKDAPNYPAAFERLGIIYLEIRKDAAKAEWAMDRALRVNGSAIVQITFDNKWRQMTKLRTGDMGFEDKRIGFLKIQSGIVTLNDAGRKTLVTISGPQIKELSKAVVSAYNLVTITTNNSRKPYIFAPEAMRQVEADLVVKLINDHVVGRP